MEGWYLGHVVQQIRMPLRAACQPWTHLSLRPGPRLLTHTRIVDYTSQCLMATGHLLRLTEKFVPAYSADPVPSCAVYRVGATFDRSPSVLTVLPEAP